MIIKCIRYGGWIETIIFYLFCFISWPRNNSPRNGEQNTISWARNKTKEKMKCHGPNPATIIRCSRSLDQVLI